MSNPGALRIVEAVQSWRSRWGAGDEGQPKVSGRRSLWAALMALVVAVLVTLVWLAGRYEISQLQAELERDSADAVSDIRTGLSQDVQALQADEFANPAQLWLSQGAQAWAQPSAANGKSCVSCHGAVATSMAVGSWLIASISLAASGLGNWE